VQYVCGQAAPEDLVLVPGGEWMVATSFVSRDAGIRIINVKDKTSTVAYPKDGAKEQLDKKTYDTCPGAPDAEQKATFQTHGVALREGRNSVHTLYVVHHGKRESIEVFELDAKVRPPSLTWVGCAVAPDPIGLNEVLPLPDGGFIGTDFLARNDAQARTRMTAGELNGALWQWHSGKGWEKIPGSEASGANGLEISKDGKTLYVAAWGNQSFFKMSLGQTPVKREDIKLGFRADNVRWAPDGQLYVTAQGGQGQAQTSNIVKVDPATLKVTEILVQPNSPEFGAGTVTIQVGKELWVGSYRGDRIAIFPAK
jgi:sugar lactone lactonase YvrE